MRLRVLVDKKISDITPSRFFEDHQTFCITMQHRHEETVDRDVFGIVLDAFECGEEGHIQKQLELRLRKHASGLIALE